MEESTATAAAPVEEQSAISQPATVFAFAPDADSVGENDTVDKAAPAGDEASAPKEQTAKEGESSTGDGDRFKGKSQKDIGAAFSAESKRLQAKYQREYEEKLNADPARQLGRLMIEDLMSQQGLSADEAAKQAADNWYKAIAKRDGVSVSMARKVFGSDVRREISRAQEAVEADSGAVDVTTMTQQKIAELERVQFPDGFDQAEAYKDDAFIDLLAEYPAAAAVRIYHAEQQAKLAPRSVAEQLRARQQIPQSMRPNQTVTPEVDFSTMSSKDFAAYKERRRKAGL